MKKIVVSDLKDDTFYAVIWLERDGELISVDSRPSDALAIALRWIARFSSTTRCSRPRRTPHPCRSGNNEDLRKWLESLSDEDLGRYKM